MPTPPLREPRLAALGALLAQTWDRLTEPHTDVQNPDQRRDAQFVASVQLLLIAMSILSYGVILPATVKSGFNVIHTVMLAAAVIGGTAAYRISRREQFQQGLLLGLLISNAALAAFAFWGPVLPIMLLTLSIIILVSGLLLPYVVTFQIVFLNFVLAVLLSFRGVDVSVVVTLVIYLVVLALLVVTLRHQREQIEHERRKAIAQALAEAKSANAALEDANAELVLANQRAAEIVRLRTEFMSTISHELRTPLNAIIGFTGILLLGLNGNVDPEGQKMLERVNANANRLLTLINDLLDLSKIEAGRLEVNDQPFSPATVLERWRAEMSILAEEKHLVFETFLDQTLPGVMLSDTNKLTQIATNLLSNAFKFTETGSVSLSLRRQDPDWIIEVTDTGIGIPKDALSYIFDEFRQVDGSQKRRFGGTGLGLAIVRKLTTMLHGTVEVRSTVGQGSTFTVRMPMRTPPNWRPMGEEMPLSVPDTTV